MKEVKTVIALVPMRHHSQRVPGKNYRLMAGKPLFHHILNTLQDVPEVTHIMVDTDSPEVAEGVARFFPGVTVLERPEHLRADDVPMNEVLLHDTAQVAGDLYLQTHSTNPLLRAATISKGIQQLLASYPAHDSLFGVTRRHVRIWDELTRPINHNPAILLQTQDLPPFFEDNSCLYIFERENLARRRNRLGERPLMFEIPAEEAMDIDNETDFKIVELMMHLRLEGKL
jgi:CMP-N-acetylneuraminic acid synthetase